MGRIAKQALLNTLLTYLGIGLGFINVVLLYPKVLHSEEFGLTRLMVSLVTVAAQVAQLGVENTVIRFFPYYKDPLRKHRGLLAAILLFATVVGSLTTLVLGLMHGWLSEVFSDRNGMYGQYGLLILPLVFGEIFFILLRSYSRSLRRTVQPTFIREFALRLMQTTLILMQAWHPMPFGTFLLLYTAIFLVCTLALVFDLWRSGHFRPGWSYLWMPGRMRRSMISYSGFTFSASLAGIVLGNMDQLMIGALLGDGLRNVAYYAVAFYFGSVIAAPGRALGQAAMPFVSEAWKRRDVTTLRVLYRHSSLVQTVVSGLLFFLMWMSLDDLFMLLPSEYAGGAGVAWVIGLAYLMNSTLGLSVGIISMSRSYRLDAYSSFGMLALNMLANYFLIRAFGIIGAAWSTFLSLLLVNVFRTGYLWKRYRLWPYGWDTLKVLLLLVALALVVPYIPLTGTPWWDMILRSLLIMAAFVPAVYAMGVFRELLPLLRSFLPDRSEPGNNSK